MLSDVPSLSSWLQIQSFLRSSSTATQMLTSWTQSSLSELYSTEPTHSWVQGQFSLTTRIRNSKALTKQWKTTTTDSTASGQETGHLHDHCRRLSSHFQLQSLVMSWCLPHLSLLTYILLGDAICGRPGSGGGLASFSSGLMLIGST